MISADMWGNYPKPGKDPSEGLEIRVANVLQCQ